MTARSMMMDLCVTGERVAVDVGPGAATATTDVALEALRSPVVQCSVGWVHTRGRAPQGRAGTPCPSLHGVRGA